MSGDKDNRGGSVLPPKLPLDRQAIDARHSNIKQNAIETMLVPFVYELVSRAKLHGVKSVSLQHLHK
jgi:hypothetical protein